MALTTNDKTDKYDAMDSVIYMFIYKPILIIIICFWFLLLLYKLGF